MTKLDIWPKRESIYGVYGRVFGSYACFWTYPPARQLDKLIKGCLVALQEHSWTRVRCTRHQAGFAAARMNVVFFQFTPCYSY